MSGLPEPPGKTSPSVRYFPANLDVEIIKVMSEHRLKMLKKHGDADEELNLNLGSCKKYF